MNHTLKTRLLQFSSVLQKELFAWREEEELELTPKLQEVIQVQEFVEIERFVPSYRGYVGGLVTVDLKLPGHLLRKPY